MSGRQRDRRGAEAGALPGRAGGQEAPCSPTQGGEDPWSRPDPPQRVWEGRAPLPRLHSCVSFGRAGGSRAAARGALRPGSGTAGVCILSSPGTLAQVTAPGTCHQALPSPAPRWLRGGLGLGSSHRLTAQEHPQAPRDHRHPGAATPLGLSCASGEEEEKHPGCFEAVRGVERRGSSSWVGRWCGGTAPRFGLSPLAS